MLQQLFHAQELDASLETLIHTMADMYSDDHHLECMTRSFGQALQAICYAYQTEVEQVAGQPAQDFLPEPNHWKHILRLPQRLQLHWLKSLHMELVLLI